MKKTVAIKKDIPKSIISGLILGIISVFVIEHFGGFSYIAKTESLNSNDKINLVEYVSSKTPLRKIYFNSPFGKQMIFEGEGFTVGDMKFTGGDFKPYNNRIKYYFKATLYDFKYVFAVSMVLALLIYFLKNFRLKLI